MKKNIINLIVVIFSLVITGGCQNNIFGDDCLRYRTLAQENARPIPNKPIYRGMEDQDMEEKPQQAAVPLIIIQPDYPRKAAMCGVEGWAQFEFTIKTDGNIKNVTLLDSSPDDTFVQAAKRALYKWRFQPATNDKKQPIESKGFYTLKFELPESMKQR